jgi:hypothetical protein
VRTRIRVYTTRLRYFSKMFAALLQQLSTYIAQIFESPRLEIISLAQQNKKIAIYFQSSSTTIDSENVCLVLNSSRSLENIVSLAFQNSKFRFFRGPCVRSDSTRFVEDANPRRRPSRSHVPRRGAEGDQQGVTKRPPQSCSPVI